MSPLPALGDSVEFTAAVEASTIRDFAELVGTRRAAPEERSTEYDPSEQCLLRSTLLVELVNTALRQLVGDGYTLKSQQLDFPATISLGEDVTVTAKVIHVRSDEQIISVETHIQREDAQTVFHGVGDVQEIELSG